MEAGGVNEVPLIVEAEELIVEAGVKLIPLKSEVAELTEASFFGGATPPSRENDLHPHRSAGACWHKQRCNSVSHDDCALRLNPGATWRVRVSCGI